MKTRISPAARPDQKQPRKLPSQSRSVATVDAIIEAAAHILERDGFEGYSTNAIAQRAGVSIGSLYQYFPNKDAVTRALLGRETRMLVDAACSVPITPDWRDAVIGLLHAAVDHQMRRPRLARLIDIEEQRLGAAASDVDAAAAIIAVLRPVLLGAGLYPPESAEEAIRDILVITRALTDAAGESGMSSRAELERRLHRAVFGYLSFQTG